MYPQKEESHVPFLFILLPRGGSSNQTQLRTSAWCYATPENTGISSRCKSKGGLCSSGNSFALLHVEGRSDLSWVLPHPVGPRTAKLESPSLTAYFFLLIQPAMQIVIDLELLQYSTTERNAELQHLMHVRQNPGGETEMGEMGRCGCYRT